jgi:exodeoxyribonuclease I
MSFVFYDTETTGTNTYFDQILQFGAIHTDDELNELDRFECRCRLDGHVVPSAGAFRVTGMTIGKVTAADLPTHYEMVCQLKEQLEKWCPTTFVGWNTLSYDEHLLRQAFYKCLHPPYLTNTNGNQRSDMLKLAQCAEAFSKDVLTVPLNEKGKPTFKLDQLAPANGFHHLNAHDAMADVEATIFICRLIKHRAPEAWQQMLHCAAKARVEEVIHGSAVFMLREYYGSVREYALTRLGEEPNGFAPLAYDLSIDSHQLHVMSDTELSSRLKRSPRPIRRIRTNAAPFVTPAVSGQSIAGLSYDTLTARRIDLLGHPGLIDRLVQLSAREPVAGSEHVEERIYDGFPSRADAALMVRFHELPWCDRFPIVEQFADDRYRAIGRRLIYGHCPESLPLEVREEQERLVAARLLGHGHDSPPWSTLDVVDGEADLMTQDAHPELLEMLAEFRAFVAEQRARAKVVLGVQ